MREARGLLVAPPISFDTRVYPAEKYSCCARNLCGNIMLKPVADNQIINFQNHVIPGYLIKYCLCDFYMWSFVLHNQFGT